MLHRIALMAIAAPRRILVVALLAMVGCGLFGVPVMKHLSAGGFQDPTTESAEATQLLVDKFGQGDMELVIGVTSESGVEGAARGVGTDIVAELAESPPFVGNVTSAWTAPPGAAPGTDQ